MAYEPTEENGIDVNEPEENYLTGYIKIYRSLRNHWIWKDPEKLKWWLDILLEVNHKDQKVSIGFELFDCKRGQSLHSRLEWAKRWKVDKSTVQRFFKLLQDDNMITTENLRKTIRLTVCKYVSYNDDRFAKQLRHVSDATQTHSRSSTNNNDKNVNNDNNDNKREARAKDFYEELTVYLDTYKPDMLRAFYNYWTEGNKSGTKMRYELEKTWDTSRRLAIWAGREKVETKKDNPKSIENHKTEFQRAAEKQKSLLNED